MTDKQARIKTILDQECKEKSAKTFCMGIYHGLTIEDFPLGNCLKCRKNDFLSARIERALKEGEK